MGPYMTSSVDAAYVPRCREGGPDGMRGEQALPQLECLLHGPPRDAVATNSFRFNVPVART